MEDIKLIAMLDEDPEKGMRELEKAYAEGLYYAVSLRLCDVTDIRECVNDTLNDFYMQRKNFDPQKGTLKAYLAKIAERNAIHKFRDNIKLNLTDKGDFVHGADMLDRWEDIELIHEAVESLPEKYRTVIKMKYFEGYETKEIADILGMNYEAVKKQLQRAYKKLQEWM